MKLTTLAATSLALLMMGGAAYAMDSEAIEKHMEEISERSVKTAEESSEVEALEQEVQELKELIRMMMDEQPSS
ncbi:hypothetical protein [Halomonas cerina]|uniref:Glutamate synthase domain-containing protein 3 n=1 Tax=Halomonas cerina TaxID=447424 RepID=A0A839VAG2_9GAMM|nr:hypothetical protein [Halomonas cerina]MBB3190945.1 glutamate synthase domain-containing protein 3 [Halomonas cerina]